MASNTNDEAGHSGKAACQDSCLSENTVLLYESVGVKDTNEAITVLFHAFMLEYGFVPKDVPAENLCHSMPEKWNEKGVFKIKYEHKCCPSHSCFMTCVPLYRNICVHGIICDVNCSESVSVTICTNDFLKTDLSSTDLSSVYNAFSNVDELSRHFKDNFCLPLLNLLHETIGVNHFYGLRGLLDELKIPLLKALPVESIVAFSAVNKDYNHLANLPFLWKYLFKRDFSKDYPIHSQESSAGTSSWKQRYIKRYKRMKRVKGPGRVSHSPIIQLCEYFKSRKRTGIDFDPSPPEIFPPMYPTFPRFFR